MPSRSSLIKTLPRLSLPVLMLIGTPLLAQSHITPGGMVSIGAYHQSLNHGYGPWKGFLLDAAWNPHQNGKYIASAVGFDRPEGSGTVYSLGKYQEFKGGFGFLGFSTSSGASYLPTFQVTTDLNLELPWDGWVIGGGVTHMRVRDGHKNTQVLLGPTLYRGNTVTTLRGYVYRSDPGQLDKAGGLLHFRHGLDDRKAWQSLRIMSGGEAYHSFVVHESVVSSGMSIALDASWPMGDKWFLQVGAEYAKKFDVYDLVGGSIRVGRLF